MQNGTQKILTSVKELQSLATTLATGLVPTDLLLLSGELGVGKTTLVRAIVNAVAPGTVVASPTFNLLFCYDTPQGKLWHFDLYRVKTVHELEGLGVDDALESGIVIAEWPEYLLQYQLDDYLLLKLDYGQQEGQRCYAWSCPQQSHWPARLKKIGLW